MFLYDLPLHKRFFWKFWNPAKMVVAPAAAAEWYFGYQKLFFGWILPQFDRSAISRGQNTEEDKNVCIIFSDFSKIELSIFCQKINNRPNLGLFMTFFCHLENTNFQVSKCKTKFLKQKLTLVIKRFWFCMDTQHKKKSSL